MISRNEAVLVVIDIQERLFQAMPDQENLLANAAKTIKGAKLFNLPVVVTEQTPEKLGRTIPALLEELAGIDCIGKKSFSAWGQNEFRENLQKLGHPKVIIIGVESHVCVYQTTLDLINKGFEVHVVADAVSSRTRENRDLGITAMQRAGAYLTSTEMVLFEIMRSADGTEFKGLQKIVK